MQKQGLNANGEPLRSVYVEHLEVVSLCSEDGRTRQEFADECDINVLMARYEKHGVLNHYNAAAPEYFDASEVPDLQTAITAMREAERAFMTLPATVRREFDNDAVKFVAYAQDPENLERMREWGLAPPLPVERVVKVEVTNPPAAEGAPGGAS